MKKTLLKTIVKSFYSVLFVVFLTGCTQELLETYITKNAVAINSMNVASNEYADLLPIGNAIGDARIVMLGEQDHGDAATFLAKTRLIKYLHEKKGFNVLAFESDFFALSEGWEKVPKMKKDIIEFSRNNIFKIWAYCDACQYLFNEYIPNSFRSEKPVQLAGFDNQMVLAYSERNLAKSIDSVLTHYSVAVTKTKSYQKFIQEDLSNLLSQYDKRNESQTFYINMGTILSEIVAGLSTKVESDNYWLLVVRNLIQYTNELAAKDSKLSNNERDKQMALNLQWLLNHKFNGEKVIVWAHNAHIMKNTDKLSYSKYSYINMTTNLLNYSDFDKQVYVLGFTSGKGVAGRIGMEKYSIPYGETNSVDGVLLKLNYPFAFFDFKEFNRRYANRNKSFLMKGSGHGYGKEQWNTIFDGVFYSKEMYPCNIVSSNQK